MQLRTYQDDTRNAFWRDLFNNAGNPLIVAPTGSGKSAIIGAIASDTVNKYAGRLILACHRKELLTQNADKIRRFTDVPLGIYSAGLNERETDQPIVCGGIQSIYNKAHLFGKRNLLLIDEAHLVPPDGEGMFRTFINDLKEINPKLRIGGLTATAFRTGSGALCGPDKIFQRICHETPILPLIEQGYLCRLTAKNAEASYDTSGLHVRGGEFVNSELERLFSDHIGEACREIVDNASGRHSLLVFCQGVAHAESVADILEKITGEEIGIVTGTTPPLERATLLDRFATNRLRWLVNVDVLTTGFDAPCIDCIAVLRATMSPGLFAQIVGRGLRIDPSKSECLVLDFGGNVDRHGKLDDPLYGKKPKRVNGKQLGEAPTKVCPNCEEESPIQSRECACGFIFPIDETRHDTKASDADLLGYRTESEWLEVNSISYKRHTKPDKPDSLKVTYEVVRDGGDFPEFVSEWVCFDHAGFPRQKANLWWRARSAEPAPVDVTEALQVVNEIKSAKRIKAHKEGNYWRIDEVEIGDYQETVEQYPIHFCERCQIETEPFKLEVGPHTGIYCQACKGWISWIPKEESHKYGEEIPF